MLLGTLFSGSLFADGIHCWLRCHHPPPQMNPDVIGLLVRRNPNPRLTFCARALGLLTTYCGKMVGIQGWKDYHELATVEGEVVRAKGSTDLFYTIDFRIKRLWYQGEQVKLLEDSRYIRIEVRPLVRIGAPLPAKSGDRYCISGWLEWDTDPTPEKTWGFLEIHPRNSNDIHKELCK